MLAEIFLFRFYFCAVVYYILRKLKWNPLSFRKNSHNHALFLKTYPQIEKNCENIRNLLSF